MPVENKIHQGRRTIPHLVWLSFTFQPTGCLPGEFIIDQRQWSSLPRPPLFPPSFPISSSFPAVTAFSIPSCQLPAQGCVKGVCKSCEALGTARGVATRMGMKEKGTVHAVSLATEPSSHAAHRQGAWGRQKQNLSRDLRRKIMGLKQRWGLENTTIPEWTFSTQHSPFPQVFPLRISPPHHWKKTSFCCKTMSQDHPKPF